MYLTKGIREEDLPKIVPPAPPPPERYVDYFAGLDLGQLHDFTAAAVIERTTHTDGKPREFAIRGLRRWKLATKYPVIVADVRELLCGGDAGALRGARLVVDATGVGRPVVDLFRALPEMKERIIAVTITSGMGAHFDANSASWHVPKMDLVGAIQSEMGTEHLKLAKALPEAQELVKELMNFRVKVSLTTGNESFEAWRERDKDDLVLALACGLWYARRAPLGAAAQGPVALTAGFGGGRPPLESSGGDEFLIV